MTDEPKRYRIKFVAGPNCPEYLLRHDGEYTYDLDQSTVLPAPGFRGWLMGRPGVMRDGLVWEMSEPPPEPVDMGPSWARALAAQLDEIKKMLQDRGVA